MGRSLYLIVLASFLSGCVPISIDSARDQFGVSTARPDAAAAGPSQAQLAELDRKAQQVCTTGYQGQAPTVQPAQDGQQIVDQQLRCSHYDHLNLDYVHMGWSNIL
jgi:hypothetical protein